MVIRSEWYSKHLAIPEKQKVESVETKNIPQKPNCKWLDVMITDFEIIECNSGLCNADLIYQLKVHQKEKHDTVYTSATDINNINVEITHNVVEHGGLGIVLDVKTMQGVTVMAFHNNWGPNDNWGIGPQEIFGGNRFMTYKIRYKVECVE